jgi:hypothetical protein
MPSNSSTQLNQPSTPLQPSFAMSSSSVPLSGSISVGGCLSTGTSTVAIDPNAWNIWSSGNWGVGSPSYYPPYQSFSYPSQSVIFKIDEGSEKDEEILVGRFNDIVGDEMHFFPQIDGKKIQPLETVMKYIKSQKKMDIKLTRIGYDIKIKGVVFKSIRNLLSKDSDTTLKVVFEYEELIYDNTLLTLEEKRNIKVRELAKKINKNDI